MNLFNIFLFGCLFCCSSSLLAQDDKYDAVYLSLIKEYTLNPDGSMDYRFVKKQKLLTYRAFQNLYGETFITYNPGFQKLKINEAYTQMADGKKIIVPENALNEVLPGFAANTPAYNALREMVITHTGLERNATIYLDYQIHSEKGTFPVLMGNELLSENEPVKNLEIIVRIPANQNLYYETFNTSVTPEKSISGPFQVFTWKVVDIPAISGEENQPGGFENYPRLQFSTSQKREEVCSFLASQPAFKYMIPESLKDEVNKLAAELTDKTELILKLQEKVVSELRLYPIPVRFTGYQCRTPEQVWNSNGGTTIEKAVLLTALLKSAGIEASPVGILRTGSTDEKSGTLSDIEDFAVRTGFGKQGDEILSVTNLNPANLNISLPGRSFIDINSDGENGLTRSETSKSRVEYSGTFIVSSDPKLTGEITIHLEGSAYPFNSLKRDKNKIKNSISGSLKSSDLTEMKVNEVMTKSVWQTFTVQSDSPFRKDSNYYYFTLPLVKTGIDGWGIKTLSTQRETPYEIPTITDESYVLTFTLPTALSLFTPQEKVNITNKAGSFLWEITVEKGKLILKRQIKFTERIFPTSIYPDFKYLMDFWNNPHYRELIFIMGK
ncbi:MAG: DUF3857 domain-containing protein [Bacteroidales bacterium]|nr:DUF3857 domain-containing protein [Bacteroidales bacterium]